METQIANNGNGVLARQHNTPPMEFSAEQRKMILGSFLSGATEAEAAVLLELARLRRLNPITRQIHFVKRWDSERNGFIWAAQVGIDGFRAIAERTGIYAGQDEPEFEYDGRQLLLCRVRVYRSDWGRPSVGVAHYAEYVSRKKDGTPNVMWASKPHVMLAKCAEALAMRRAFPEDVSGLYTPEETATGDEHVDDATPAPAAPRASQTASVKALLARHVVDVAPETDSRELENAQAEASILTPRAAPPAPAPAPSPAAPPVRRASARIVDVAPDETEAQAETRQADEPPPPGDDDAPPLVPGRAQSPPPKASTRPAAPSAGAITMAFGRGKGVPLADLDLENLEWYAKVLAENVADKGKARFRDDNQSKLDAINAEITRRES